MLRDLNREPNKIQRESDLSGKIWALYRVNIHLQNTVTA